jgi:teichoic acid transport system ATP-binding protein
MAAADLGLADDGVPTVVVEDLHVTYRVHGRGQKGNAVDALRRTLRGERRPGTREIHAVRGVNLVARRGDSIGVIGRNGSGKSTLLRAIAGLLPPDRGQVFTEGQPSLLGVNAALVRDLTGARNIELGCLAMGMTREQVREKFDEIVEFSGIGDFVDLPMATYSSGMAARLRFSIAAAKKHDVLLIDEALATGDAKFRKRSEQRVRELRAEAGTVFLVSHSEQTIRDTCERSIWLESGELRADGPTEDVMQEYEHYVNK